MDLIDIENFSITLTVPAFKKVFYNAKRVSYGALSQNQQFHFLEDIIQMNVGKFDTYDWIYEEHEDKRLHVHMYVWDTHEELVKDFIYNFYNYNSRIGIKYRSYSKLSNYQKTLVSQNYWLEYMEKHQDEIKYRRGYIQEKQHSNNLDSGTSSPVKLEFNNSSLHLPNWVEEPEENNKYGFGKKTKFLVEI